jgi:hypothetical protein
LEVALLLVGLGSGVVELMLSVSEMTVPEAVPAVTCKIGAKVAVPPEAKVAMVHVMAPVAPAAGFVQAHPDGVAMETKVVFVGSVSVKLTFAAAAGPLFETN